MDKLEQINALAAGEGVQYLLDAAYDIFQKPMVIFDTNYSLKGFTDVIFDDPIWNEIVSTGSFSMKTQEFFAKECFTEEVANADMPIILKSEQLDYDRILGHIFNKDDIKVANLVMCGDAESFDADVMAAFAILAEKITSEIRDDEYFTAFGRAFHETIIVKLLDREINDPMIYTPHVQILYDGFDDYLYAAVVDVSQNAGGRDAEYFKALLEREYPSYKHAVYAGYIVMIMGSKHSDSAAEQLLGKYNGLFEQYGLFVGVSGSFENIYQLRDHFDQAVAALKNGMERDNGQRVFTVA